MTNLHILAFSASLASIESRTLQSMSLSPRTGTLPLSPSLCLSVTLSPSLSRASGKYFKFSCFFKLCFKLGQTLCRRVPAIIKLVAVAIVS